MNDKQAAFVREYLVDKNGSAAARRAGYSEKTAHAISSRLLRDPRVSGAVKTGLDKLAQETGVIAERVLQEYARVAFSDPTDFVQIKDGAVSVTDTAELTPAQAAALEAIARHLRMFIDRSEITSTISLGVL